MSCTEYELVARVGKARGLEGEVTATTAGNLPFSVYEGLHVHVVPPTLDGPRELDVCSVCEGAATPISFASTASTRLTPQSRLPGRFLLADVRDLEDLNMPVRDIGRGVVDERHGELGEIREVIETAAHDVWVIDGPHGEVLVPVVDEVIVAYPMMTTASFARVSWTACSSHDRRDALRFSRDVRTGHVDLHTRSCAQERHTRFPCP